MVQPVDSKAANTLDIRVFDWLRDKLESPAWRDRCFGEAPYPTQILVNEYNGLDGIASHFEDEEAFGETIATVSLLAPTLMSMQVVSGQGVLRNRVRARRRGQLRAMAESTSPRFAESCRRR